MLKCNGYHGTSQSNVASILKNGYLVSDKTNTWLGNGVYFFGDLLPLTSGFEEAKSWQLNVNNKTDWAVLVADIKSEKYIDLIEEKEHRRLFENVRRTLLQIHESAGKDRRSFRDRIIFLELWKRYSIDVIRACTEGRKNDGYFGYVIRRLQVQICVTETNCITNNRLKSQGK